MRVSKKASDAKKKMVASGQVLCKNSSNDGYVYFLHPSGAAFPKEIGDELIKSGDLRGSQDGLFPGESQTFLPVP